MNILTIKEAAKDMDMTEAEYLKEYWEIGNPNEVHDDTRVYDVGELADGNDYYILYPWYYGMLFRQMNESGNWTVDGIDDLRHDCLPEDKERIAIQKKTLNALRKYKVLIETGPAHEDWANIAVNKSHTY